MQANVTYGDGQQRDITSSAACGGTHVMYGNSVIYGKNQQFSGVWLAHRRKSGGASLTARRVTYGKCVIYG